MTLGTWLIVALVVGVVLVLVVAASRGRRRILWCPEREMLAEVETGGDTYTEDAGGRPVFYCSLWEAVKGERCNRACVTRFTAERKTAP